MSYIVSIIEDVKNSSVDVVKNIKKDIIKIKNVYSLNEFKIFKENDYKDINFFIFYFQHDISNFLSKLIFSIKKPILFIINSKNKLLIKNFNIKKSDYLVHPFTANELNFYLLYFIEKHLIKTIIKNLETDLKNSQKKHKLISKITTDFIYSTNISHDEYKIDWITGSYKNIFEYDIDEIKKLSNGCFTIMHPDDKKMILPKIKKCIKLGKTKQFEYRIITKKGNIKWLNNKIKPLIDNKSKKTTSFIAAVNDITDKKNTADAYLSLINESLLGITVIQDYKIVFANKAFEKLSGYNSKKLYKLTSDQIKNIIHPDDQDQVWHKIKRWTNNEKIDPNSEFRIIQKKGNIKWVVTLANLIHYNNKPSIQMEFLDITERKKSEEIIQKSEKKYRLLFNEMIDGFALHEIILDKNYNPIDYKFLDINPAFERLTGLKKKNIIGKNVKTVLPNTENYWIEKYGKVAITGEPITFENFSEELNKYYRVTAFCPQKGQFACIFEDITSIILANKKLKESEEKFRRIFNNSPLGIAIISLELFFLQINKRICEISGYKELELKKIKIIDLIHKDDKEKIIILVNKMLNKEIDFFTMEIRCFHKNSSIIWVSGTATLVKNDKNMPLYAIVMIEDITERKKSEKLLQKNLKEKNILLQEIHHRVKNNLQIISSLLGLQSIHVNDKYTKEIFKDSQNRIISMSLIHQLLYKSDDFSQIYFKDYITNLANTLYSMFEISYEQIKFKIHVLDISLNINQAIPCGLIINELISNCIKYAFPDNKKGKIEINFIKEKKSYILSIIDNGIGLPKNFDIKSNGTLGYQLITTLTDQLEGKIDIINNNGTNVTITFPVKHNN